MASRSFADLVADIETRQQHMEVVEELGDRLPMRRELVSELMRGVDHHGAGLGRGDLRQRGLA